MRMNTPTHTIHVKMCIVWIKKKHYALDVTIVYYVDCYFAFVYKPSSFAHWDKVVLLERGGGT